MFYLNGKEWDLNSVDFILKVLIAIRKIFHSFSYFMMLNPYLRIYVYTVLVEAVGFNHTHFIRSRN